MCCKKGEDISVGIATRYGLDGPGIESRCGPNFSAPVQTGPGVHPASYTMGTGSFPEVKRPGRGVNHPPHLAPRLKKEYSYSSTPPSGPSWPFLGRTLHLHLPLCCSRAKPQGNLQFTVQSLIGSSPLCAITI